ncbi:MAG: MerR family transcriptional regulator [Meiothermus silvanus]|nr:MerR family transcriptional regulator [Allomeiothermus silvanus]
MQQGLYTIGEVSKLSGLPVQTIRYYSDIGVLPPSRVTEAGYRLYSEADCARLELVRTLRGVGFDLKTITGLLNGELGPVDAVRLQIEALEVQVRALKRQQTLLNAVLQTDETTLLTRLNRMQTLAKLDKLEREHFLAQHVRRGLGGGQGDPAVWRAAVLDLPEEMSEAQLEAWLELAEIASDPSFQQGLRNQTQAFSQLERLDWAKWKKVNDEATKAAIEAVQTGLSPGGQQAQKIIGKWVAGLARAMQRKNDKRFAAWLLERFETTTDPRMDRYWELIAVLKGWTYTPDYAKAYGWLLEGLRQHITPVKPTTISHRGTRKG